MILEKTWRMAESCRIVAQLTTLNFLGFSSYILYILSVIYSVNQYSLTELCFTSLPMITSRLSHHLALTAHMIRRSMLALIIDADETYVFVVNKRAIDLPTGPAPLE